MSIWARVAAFGLITIFSGSIGAAAQAAECGQNEDAERASHRQLSMADFSGARPSENGRPRSGGATAILITTAIAVDELAAATERQADQRWIARVSELCVRAYLMKALSGRRSEVKAAWDLRHEQGHFDLTLAHARSLERSLRELTFAADDAKAATRGLRALARETYRARVADLQREQDLYDRETRHGHSRAAQGRWLAEIAARLAPTSTAVVIRTESAE